MVVKIDTENRIIYIDKPMGVGDLLDLLWDFIPEHEEEEWMLVPETLYSFSES
jgi:hypothetical protein